MEDIDRRLLNLIQASFPMTAAPFADLAATLGTSEADVLERIAALKQERYIRQISAIFDTRSLGYQSSLVAMRVPAERADEAAAIINEHPGVSHNYRRKHAFNLWFTIAVPPAASLERTIEVLHRLAGAEATNPLPTLRLFKIGVKLDMVGDEDATATSEPVYSEKKRPPAGAAGLGPRDMQAIRELQEDLALEPRPFAAMAARIGIDEDQLLETARDLQERGYMRRYAAILHHRKAGFKANAMGVWVVPPDEVEAIGTRLASFNAVSHCYQRPTYPDWPYNVFTMIHAHNLDECEAILRTMSEKTGVSQYMALYSTKEYKKVRLTFYTPEWEEWERKHLGAAGGNRSEVESARNA